MVIVKIVVGLCCVELYFGFKVDWGDFLFFVLFWVVVVWLMVMFVYVCDLFC